MIYDDTQTLPRRGEARAAFITAAKKVNPGVSDADLGKYYDQKYGT